MVDVDRATQMFEALASADGSTVLRLSSEKIRGYVAQGWSVDEYIRDVWAPALDELAGKGPRITAVENVSPSTVCVTVEGHNGRAYLTMPFEPDGSIAGFALDREKFEGIGNLVINCPGERRDELAAFYGALLGTDRWRIPRLVFDEGFDYHPPVWGDPERPQQLHLEIDVADLGVAHDVVTARGATLLEESDEHRTYADPIGHALRLQQSHRTGEPVGVLARVVIDCISPRGLAPFYADLLRMSVRVQDSMDRVVITADNGRLPMLAFRRVSPYVPPRWPDPAFPAQMHFDIKIYDRDAGAEFAERLGAVRLPKGGSCPVYADPAGHPFCLCVHGE